MHPYLLAVLLAVVAAAVIARLFVRRFPKDHPPGPRFRVPFFGQLHAIGNDRLGSFRKLREKYGDIFSVEIGPFNMIIVNDNDILKEMLSDPNYDDRWTQESILTVLRGMKGGNGMHGLVGSIGEEWKEQRRFALQHLRDFGLGKPLMEGIMVEEANELCDDIRGRIGENDEIKLDETLNLIVLNILWRIVAGKRYDLKDERQLENLKKLGEGCRLMGTSPRNLAVFSLPGFVLKLLPKENDATRCYRDIFALADAEYEEHLKTYSEDDPRDLIDCYIKERRRVEKENETGSSFFGSVGQLNYRNSIFDLFVAGSETTSSTMLWAILYMMHNPEIQSKAQKELDEVVGRSRPLLFDDKSRLPYLNAVIAEVQRCGNVVPFSLDHSNANASKIRGYVIPAQSMIVPNLDAVLADESHFENPSRFKPERFICPETGTFRPHPALVPFGIGRRQCPGKNLASQEIYILLGVMLQQFSFSPASEGLPDLNKFHTAVIRMPEPFSIKVSRR